MSIFLNVCRCRGVRFAFEFYGFVQGIVAIIKVLQIVIYRIFRIGICRPACRDFRVFRNRLRKIVIPTHEGIARSRGFGFGCKIVFFDYLFFNRRTAVCVERDFIHRATANGYRKQFHIVTNLFQHIKFIIANRQFYRFAFDRVFATHIYVYNISRIAFHRYFIDKREYFRVVAYLAVDFRAVHSKGIEQNARFCLEHVTANGAGLGRGCRSRCACRVFFFVFFITAFAFVPMVGGVARPFFRIVFVGELVDRLGFCCRFANRTRIGHFAFFRAGRGFGFRAVIPSMYARRRDFFVCGIIATFSFAGYIFVPPNFRTSGCFRLVCFLIMPNRRNVFRIAIATGAGISDYTFFRTGRLGSSRRIFVGMVLVELCIYLHITG